MDLVVLAKEPRPGRVKTRLCPPCTPEQAASIAGAALHDTLAAALGAGADRVVLALDGAPGPWCPPGVVVVEQGDGPLDVRLARLWGALPGAALQIGMDTPQVTAAQLADALRRLDRTGGGTSDGTGVGAVLGPALDGGWWALGMRRPDPTMLLGIETSRADTGARQLARLRAAGLEVWLLDAVRDVDTWADARIVALDAPDTTFAGTVSAIAAGRAAA